MKKLIYFDNSQEITMIQNKYEKQLMKLSNEKKIDMKKITLKMLDSLTILNNIYNINKEYDLILTSDYNKIITIILLQVCNNYIQLNNKKPHIILSNNESKFVINLCKKLIKSNIIDNITIIDHLDIITEFKSKKQDNTLCAFISNDNNGLIYDLTKLTKYCKYYNIILVSNMENNIYNYVYNNSSIINNLYFLNNQDIISINYYNQKTKIYIILFKKHFLKKYNININNKIFNNLISNESIIYLLNIISYYNVYELMYNKVHTIFNDFITQLNKNYKIINYNDFMNIKKIYLTNTATIILLNNIYETQFLLNNIILSIYIQDINFTNNQLVTYFKSNGVIINNNLKLSNIIPKKILNGLIILNFSYLTKSLEIYKLIQLIDNFINLHINKHNIKISKIKSKKHIKFQNPEFIILSKPFEKKSKLPLKGILKKR